VLASAGWTLTQKKTYQRQWIRWGIFQRRGQSYLIHTFVFAAQLEIAPVFFVSLIWQFLESIAQLPSSHCAAHSLRHFLLSVSHNLTHILLESPSRLSRPLFCQCEEFSVRSLVVSGISNNRMQMCAKRSTEQAKTKPEHRSARWNGLCKQHPIWHDCQWIREGEFAIRPHGNARTTLKAAAYRLVHNSNHFKTNTHGYRRPSYR
jgi:hypothetical protein